MKVLITGYKSGLGYYLKEYFGGVGFDSDSELEQIPHNGVDLIIHCAFNRTREVNSKNLYQYLSDNIFTTKKLIKIPHKKFIYISSVDVYPKNNKKHLEKELIDIDQVSNIYGITKLMSESIVKKECSNYLILRCAALLGVYARPNSLIKIAEEKQPIITLSSSSVMNYILHSQVADFINFAVKNDLTDIYNLASSGNITLSRVADMLSKKTRFGSYSYNVGNISNSKITSIFPAFARSSEDTVREFLKEDFPKRK